MSVAQYSNHVLCETKKYFPDVCSICNRETQKTGVSKFDWKTLYKITLSDVRNSQQLFAVEKTQHEPLSGENW